MSFNASKKSLAGYKGHYGIVLKAFTSLVALQPRPTEEAVSKSYLKVQERMEKLFKALDNSISLLESEGMTEEEKEKENDELLGYYEKILADQNIVETQYATFKAEGGSNSQIVTPAERKTTIKLTALSPPVWSGVKADFYTWKKKFEHIMKGAKIDDAMTQLCYLQNPNVLPKEYQTLISDCSSIHDVWSRLEERVPESTIKHEVIQQFRRVKLLPSKRSAIMLREFANEISLFCRRMADLNYSKENYTCIIMQDIYEKLDRDTALRYRSKVELKRELGNHAEEDLESLSAFLRAEATTLELTMGDSFSRLNVNSIDSEKEELPAEKEKCTLGCDFVHRFVDCNVYTNMTPEKRREFIKSSMRCYICLGKFHLARSCSSRKKCSTCNGNYHHTSLCLKVQETNTLNSATPPFQSLRSGNNSSLALSEFRDENSIEVKPRDYSPLVIVEIKRDDGSWTRAKCFLDGGSNSSLVRNKFAKDNRLHGSGACNIQLGVAGGGIHREERSEEFEVEIRPLGREESYFIIVSGVKKPCFNVRPISKNIFKEHKHLQTVQDKVYIDGGEVDFLIGRDYAPLIVDESTLRASVNPDESPSVAFTRLGSYLYGGMSKVRDNPSNNILSINHINKWEENETKIFFYGDILGVKPTSLCVCSDNEIAESTFIKHMRATTRIDENGRVCIQMPWKPGYPEKLPNNYQRAIDQLLRRERQLSRNGKVEEYNNEVEKLIQRGVVKKLSLEESKNVEQDAAWYLNHRIIERLDKNSSKLRIVFDSAAPYKGICLNDALQKGPVYTNSLFRCLLKWRRDYVAVAGDIEKMFNQVSMTEADQRYHRFLWRNGDESRPVIVYQWLRVLFGDKPSPDIAAYALRFLTEKMKSVYPRGASILEEETYVDDVVFSEENTASARKSISDVDTILAAGNFKIKLWNSNDFNVDQNSEENEVDVLGHHWNKRSDTISSKFNDRNITEGKEFTKRTLLGYVAKLWDPYGYLLPVSIQYRIELQRIWHEGYGWDETIPKEMVENWTEYLNQMQQLCEIKLNRCVKPTDVVGLPQLHAFSDGGNDAYGTCIFVRWPTENGVKISFVAAKAFVAPLKRKTIPRIELMGALAMSRIMREVIESLGYDFEYKRFWIDSQIVIYWLLSDSSRYKPFVSTRVQEFQDTHPNWKEEVRYVHSEDNSADCLTKPIPVNRLTEWHDGRFSRFLEGDEKAWSSEIILEDINTGVMKEMLEEKSSLVVKKKVKPRRQYKDNPPEKNIMICSLNEEPKPFGYVIAEEYSSWVKMVTSVAFLKRSLKHRKFSEPALNSPIDIAEAEKYLFYLCQEELRQELDNAAKRFAKFDPFSDSDKIIRAKGRLQNVEMDNALKHPIILPAEHPLVRIFLTYFHRKLLHQGYRVVIANLMHEGFLIGGGKQLLKSIANRCIFCRIRRRKLLQQMMGNLPSFRIQVQKPPFTSAAIDFFGPLKVKQSRNVSVNGSVLIVTCTTTRCIHLELCLMMDTNTFLRAWRRFVTTRGVHPAHVFSDGGTNFVGAQPLILEWIKAWDQQLIQQQFSRTAFDFEWEFNVPTASHMNGVVESLINSIRKALDATITNYTRRILTYEEWSTVLAEISYIVNSRPLFPEGDPWEFNCITANDILYPHGQPNLPQFKSEGDDNVRDMFKTVQNRVDVFWSTWLKHIPPQLLSRNKWFHPRSNLEIGDFVIVLEKGMKGNAAPRSLWKKAIVTKVHPGDDGLVRSVTVKDSNHVEYRRPIHKLCLIATRAELAQ